MIYAPIETTDFRLLQPEVIWLEPEDFDRATEMGDRATLFTRFSGESARWQTYVNGLGLFAFTRWLAERNLILNSDQSNLWQSHNVLDAVCRLQLGEFKLCLIVTEHLLDDAIALPRAAVDLPELAAHFYVLLEVQEELEQVAIQGMIRHDQIMSYRDAVNLQAGQDWYYSIPLSLFDAEPNHLVSYVHHLSPAAIALPTHAPQVSEPAMTPAALQALIRRLQSTAQPLWQTLTWNQAAAILPHPEFLELLGQAPQPDAPASISTRLTEVFTLLTQPVINAGQWVQGEMDAIAQNLGLVLPETLAATAPMLSVDRFERAIAELRHQGMEIPEPAACAYQDIDLHGVSLRLCIVTWATAARAEWSLLFLLGMTTGNPLPPGLKLRISTISGVLHEPVAELDDPFLFVRVRGMVGDRFVVTIAHPDQMGLTLPAFGFEAV